MPHLVAYLPAGLTLDQRLSAMNLMGYWNETEQAVDLINLAITMYERIIDDLCKKQEEIEGDVEGWEIVRQDFINAWGREPSDFELDGTVPLGVEGTKEEWDALQ
jgi:hypothetical protein